MPPHIVEPPWQRTRLRVPRDDGAMLAQPALSQVLALARNNAALLATSDATLLDQPLSEFRQQVRGEILAIAQQETASLLAATGLQVSSATTSSPFQAMVENSRTLLIATGHQPELFHPGVWIKQLTIAALARQHRAIGLNLVIDNDTLHSTAMRVPVGTRDALSIESIAFDTARPAQPWEEAAILDRSLFESFADRVLASIRPWGLDPFLNKFWQHVIRCSQSAPNLAFCFTAARARVENDWGLGNLELRLSRLCESISFRRFALHLIRNAERLRTIYNETVAEYRDLNRIRNASHPVPDLLRVGEWIESPLWIWRAGATSRGRVFVSQRQGKLSIVDAPDASRVVLELDAESINADLQQLSELSERGWRLRSRALTTTCFARLCLSDVFAHGIGGAKYDEITDRLMTRFFGVTAPSFVTLSATAHLPFTSPFEATADDVRHLKHQLRDTQQNAQRHLSKATSSHWDTLLTERESLVREQCESDARRHAGKGPSQRDGSGYRRYRRLRELTHELAASTLDIQSRLTAELVRHQHEVAANDIIRSREFACWLYPERRLRELLTGLNVDASD